MSEETAWDKMEGRKRLVLLAVMYLTGRGRSGGRKQVGI